MIETISEYIDLNLLGIGVLLLLSYILLKVIFKQMSMPKFVAVLLVLLFLGGNGYIIYLYIEQEEAKMIDTQSNFYVAGNVEFVSNSIKRVRISYTKTNMIIRDLEDKDLVILVPASAVIYDKNEKKRITLEYLKQGDYVSIVTEKNMLKDGNNELVAKKLVKY